MEVYVPYTMIGMPESDLDMHIMHQEGEFAPPSPCEDPEEKPNSPDLSGVEVNA